VFADGRAVGHNTDAQGFTRTVREEVGFDFQGRTMLMIGAGGVARAMAAGAAAAGAARIVIHARRAERAAALAEGLATHYPQTRFEPTAGDARLPRAAAEADLVAN